MFYNIVKTTSKIPIVKLSKVEQNSSSEVKQSWAKLSKIPVVKLSKVEQNYNSEVEQIASA